MTFGEARASKRFADLHPVKRGQSWWCVDSSGREWAGATECAAKFNTIYAENYIR